MPKTLAEGRRKLTFLSTRPLDLAAITVTELTAGVDLSLHALNTGYQLGPTGSDTVNEKAIADKGNATVFGASNYAGNITFFRYLDPQGASEAGEDVAWETFVGKGVHGYLVERIGKDGTVDWAASDEYAVYEVMTDDPQPPQEMTGYVKFTQPFGVGGEVELRGVVAAGV